MTSAREPNSTGQAHHHQQQRPDSLKIRRDSHQISKHHQQSSSQGKTTSLSNNPSSSSFDSTIQSAETTPVPSDVNNSFDVECGGRNHRYASVTPQSRPRRHQPQQRRHPVMMNSSHAPMQAQKPFQLHYQPSLPLQHQRESIYSHAPLLELQQCQTEMNYTDAQMQALWQQQRFSNRNSGQPPPAAFSLPGNHGASNLANAMYADLSPLAISTPAGVPMYVQPSAQVPSPAPQATAYVEGTGAPPPAPTPLPPRRRHFFTKWQALCTYSSHCKVFNRLVSYDDLPIEEAKNLLLLWTCMDVAKGHGPFKTINAFANEAVLPRDAFLHKINHGRIILDELLHRDKLVYLGDCYVKEMVRFLQSGIPALIFNDSFRKYTLADGHPHDPILDAALNAILVPTTEPPPGTEIQRTMFLMFECPITPAVATDTTKYFQCKWGPKCIEKTLDLENIETTESPMAWYGSLVFYDASFLKLTVPINEPASFDIEGRIVKGRVPGINL